MPFKFTRQSRKIEILLLLFLNITASYIFCTSFSGRFEAVQAMAEGKTPVTIIMYHHLLKDSSRGGKYVISPTQFENDVKYLVDNGYNFITMTDLINFVNKKRSRLPDKPVMLTFDDGYYNNYMYAYPIMQKYNGNFVLSVIGYHTEINKEGEKMSGYYSHVTWDQIREMSESGVVDIQNHSYNLHVNKNGRSGSAKKSGESLEEYKEFLTADLTNLQKLLKKNSGVVPNTFTYPFGRISPEAEEILKELGFDAALTCREGINYIGKADKELLFKLKRYNRPNGIGSADFFKGKLERQD